MEMIGIMRVAQGDAVVVGSSVFLRYSLSVY